MRTSVSRVGLPSSIAAGFAGALAFAALAIMSPANAMEPSAAGLWQKVENGKPVVWVLVVDHDGVNFEGVIAREFPDPGETTVSDDVCSKCTDDRKNAPCLAFPSSAT